MIEVEVKAVSNRKVKENIKEKGELLEEIRQKDIYLNHPNRDFAKTDEALRLRKSNKCVFLTYKGPKIDKETKSREEIEERVESLKKSLKIFESLKFNKTEVVEKKRLIYKIGDYKASIDKVKNLGEFIELEKKVKELNNKTTKEAKKFLKKLGVKEKDFIRKSYLELLLEQKTDN